MADKKPLTKVLNGAFLIIVGCVLIAIGLSLGGKWNVNWQFSPPWLHDSSDSLYPFADTDTIRPISSSEGSIPSTIKSVDVDIPFGSITIKTGNTPGYSILDYGVLTPTVSIKNDEIKISASGDTRKITIPKGIESPRLEIILPSNITFKEMSVGLGAGSLFVDGVVAEEIQIKIGAGECRFLGDILKKGSVSTGAGAVSLLLFGAEELYAIDFSRGVGDVVIGSSSWSGTGSGVSGPRAADRKIKLRTGVGELRVEFEKPSH